MFKIIVIAFCIAVIVGGGLLFDSLGRKVQRFLDDMIEGEY